MCMIDVVNGMFCSAGVMIKEKTTQFTNIQIFMIVVSVNNVNILHL